MGLSDPRPDLCDVMTYRHDSFSAASESRDARCSGPAAPGPRGEAAERDAPGLPETLPPALTSEMEAQVAAAHARLDRLLGQGDDGAERTDALSRPAASSQRMPVPGRSRVLGPRQIIAGREVRPGTIVAVGPTDVFVEFGPKELGVIPRSQWGPDEPLPGVGEIIEAVVDHRDDDGALVCSRPGAVRKADWELLEPGQVIEARVIGVNRGGLELDVAGHVAFLPAGQVALEHVPDLSVYVGEKLRCRVQHISRAGRGSIVLSRRDLLLEERRQRVEQLKATLAEGQIVEGTVRRIVPFGAFVDLGGIDGLIRVSDLTYERIQPGEKNVQRYVKEGDRVRVQILKLDWEAGHIGLGLKQVQGDLFAAAAGQIKAGDEISGRVTRLTEFGAFVEIAPGVDGLIHISELSWQRVRRADDVVQVGQVVRVKVLQLDAGSRRISLSLRATQQPPIEPGSARASRAPAQLLSPTSALSPQMRRLRAKLGQRPLKGGIG